MKLVLVVAPLALALGACVDIPKTNLADAKLCTSDFHSARTGLAQYRPTNCSNGWAGSNAIASANWSNTGQGASSLEPTGPVGAP